MQGLKRTPALRLHCDVSYPCAHTCPVADAATLRPPSPTGVQRGLRPHAWGHCWYPLQTVNKLLPSLLN